MATSAHIYSVSAALNEIPKMVETCQQVVAALLEMNRSWSRAHWILLTLFPTDYDRSRNRIVYTCSVTRRELKNLRRATISPESIRALTYVTDIRRCCRKCRKINRANMKANKQFQCQVKEQLNRETRDSFRFRLNEKGQIIEKR